MRPTRPQKPAFLRQYFVIVRRFSKNPVAVVVMRKLLRHLNCMSKKNQSLVGCPARPEYTI